MTAFQFSVDENQIGVIVFNLEGEKVNKLSLAVMEEAARLFEEIARRTDVKAVVLVSGKDDNFIVGADVHEFLKIESTEQAEQGSRWAQSIMQKIENSKKPVVAAIHGACLGGGMEVALACHYRIVSDDKKTQLGQPEVQLGLLPGAGGTQRLPRLVGLRKAIEMVTTGKSYRSDRAKKMGLCDEVVPKAILLDVAKQRAQE